jgi:outer membrane protein assembly factor BamB
MTRRLCTLLLFSTTLFAGDWPQWRGPDSNGVSSETALPLKWSASENVAWKVPLPGRGMSTPIVVGDRVFVTSQIGAGIVDATSARYEGPIPKNEGTVTFVIQCFRRSDGRLEWKREVQPELPLPAVHMFHNLATPSPVSDGERLYCWFGTGQLLALTFDGTVVWQRSIARDYSTFKVQWAHGSSPVVYKNTLILQCDHDPAGYLLALDCRTGKQVWKTDRGSGLRSYSTPLVVAVGDRRELVVNSNPRIDGYDADTGEHLWYTDGNCRVPIGMAVAAGGIVYASRGYNSGPFLALRPGGRGDVTGTHVLWRIATGAPYVSSLLYYQDLIYMATEVGVVRCVDPKTGETVWAERLGGNFSASPIGAEGRVYLLNEEGEAVVLAAGRKYNLLARNTLGELCRASPAVSGSRLFIRTDQNLYAIGR